MTFAKKEEGERAASQLWKPADAKTESIRNKDVEASPIKKSESSKTSKKQPKDLD